VAWAAGLFEGEGCLSKDGDKWRLIVVMTDVDVIMHFASIYDLTVKSFNFTQPEHYKQCFTTRTGKRDLIFKIVSDFYPYLGERRREKCNEFLAWYQEKQRETSN